MNDPKSNGKLNGSTSGAIQARPFDQCKKCKEMIYVVELKKNLMVCPKCNNHFRLNAYERIELLVDDIDAFEEHDGDLRSTDPLRFVSKEQAYSTKLDEYRGKSGVSESVIAGMGTIEGRRVSLAVM